MKYGKKTKLIILTPRMDDRMTLWKHLQQEPNIEVVGVTADPYQARDQIVYHHPHILVLALELPRMSGLDFLEVLHKFWPIPSIAISNRLGEHPELANLAKARGSVAVFDSSATSLAEIAKKIPSLVGRHVPKPGKRAKQPMGNDMVIAIGASTGGTDALRAILRDLPLGMPPILVVQHMPKKFTTLFAASLDKLTALSVIELTSCQRLQENTVMLAAGDRHMVLLRRGSVLEVDVRDGEPVRKHKPSVDVLFQSVAETMGERAMGILLTGMGADGARGLLAMYRAGAYTLAQDKASSVVYGMPREAVALGAVRESMSLPHIRRHMLSTIGADGGNGLPEILMPAGEPPYLYHSTSSRLSGNSGENPQ